MFHVGCLFVLQKKDMIIVTASTALARNMPVVPVGVGQSDPASRGFAEKPVFLVDLLGGVCLRLRYTNEVLA